MKMNYYKRRIFHESLPLRLSVLFLIVLIGVWNIILSLVMLPDDIKSHSGNLNVYESILSGLMIFFYLVSTFKSFQNESKIMFNLHYSLIILTFLCYTACQGLETYYMTKDQVESNSREKWFYGLMRNRNEAWVVIVFEILTPSWVLRILYPLTKWVVMLVIYYNEDLDYKFLIWQGFASYMVFICIGWKIKSYGEWKNFVKKSNAEAWDGVHMHLLNKLPHAIAIVDEKHDVVYSNDSFRSVCQNNITKLARNLCNIRRTDVPSDSEKTNDASVTLKTLRIPEKRQKATQFEEEDALGIGRTERKEMIEGSLDLKSILENVMTSISKGTAKSDEYSVYSGQISKNESSRDKVLSFEIKVGPLLEFGKVILILSDTTGRDHAISLEAANSYKDKLLATVSHDLRAPINGGLAFIENVIHHEDVGQSIIDEYLVPAQRSMRFLLHLVNDILDFSQINAQKLRLSFEELSIVETVKTCYHLVEMQAASKGINFKLNLDDRLPKTFTTDHNRLSQIIINLLSNAIKFTSKGEIVMTATRISESFIEIKVCDTGIGIKEEDQKKLFQDFTRISYEQKGMNTQGVGLGLSIANNLAQKLGPGKRGGINVASEYGKGTKFSFWLDDKSQGGSYEGDFGTFKNIQRFRSSSKYMNLNSLDQEENFTYNKIDEVDLLNVKSLAPSPNISSMSINRYEFSPSHVKEKQVKLLPTPAPVIYKKSKPRILVVDDNPLNVLAMECMLGQQGLIIEKAFNGEEAISKILHNQNVKDLKTSIESTTDYKILEKTKPGDIYKLIFMDYEMPVLNGIETTKRLLDMMESSEIKFIPIIGCTAHDETEKMEECFASGMADVINKPPQRQQLLNLVRKYVNLN